MVSHAVAIHEAGAMLRKTPEHKTSLVKDLCICGVHMRALHRMVSPCLSKLGLEVTVHSGPDTHESVDVFTAMQGHARAL